MADLEHLSRPRTLEKELGENELTYDRRAWSAFVPDVVNLIGDTRSTRPGHKVSIGFTKED